MFRFAGSGLALAMAGLLPPGCPIQERADLRSFAAPRAFSQLVAPFLASGRLGIRRTPLSA